MGGFWGFRENGYLFLGIWGEGSFIFKDLGRFWGFRERGAEEKHFRELGRKVICLSGSREQRPPLGGPQMCTHRSMNIVSNTFCFELFISFSVYWIEKYFINRMREN